MASTLPRRPGPPGTSVEAVDAPYPPELVAEGFARLSDRDLALIEDYLYPEGIENAPSLTDIDWEQEPTGEQEDALGRLAALIGDVKDEWGV